LSHAVLWSGGKDSLLALHRARRGGLDVRRLLNFHDADTRRVRFHGTRLEMLQAQAEMLGVELISVGTTWGDMEARLRGELAALAAAGFEGVVLGDIHLADVRAWYEERVTAAGLAHVEPLWGEAPLELLREFVGCGGRAVVTCVDLEKLDEGWLGRVIDGRFVEQVGASGVDPSGENGEYHSFAFAGAAFAAPVRWVPGARRSDGRFAQLDILGGEQANTGSA
jgi:uncharacterized protein (TIGR00290 family)